jgi:N6-L-threonylcarbamoyladenine synthase
MSRAPLLLGIETSCDETAAAVVSGGRTVRSSVVHSQVATHHRFGGIVPELAGREHIRAITPVVAEALARAGTAPGELAAVGVATHPGLLGALLVGLSFAKAYAWSLGIPLVEVDHLEGHITSIFLAGYRPRFPFIALVVSGGHTSLFVVEGPTRFTVVGRTRDDAAGEAFDKVAKHLGLGYPGGPVLERLAREGNREAHRLPRAWIAKGSLDFSFSGLKTAVIGTLARHPRGGAPGEWGGAPLPPEAVADLAASFQEAVADVLVAKTLAAAHRYGCRTAAVVGGVAANGYLRQRFAAAGEGVRVLFPPPALCTDNAAMIAAAAAHHLREGRVGSLQSDASARHRPG